MNNYSKILNTINQISSFKDLDLSIYANKSVILETTNSFYYGKATPSKTGLTVAYKDKEKNINIFDIKSIVCEGKRTVVDSIIKPQYIKEWNECLAEAKKTTVKGVLHKACKCYEEKSGVWNTEKQIITENEIKTDENLLLRDRLKDCFFENRTVLLEKDIVHHEHENSMTPEEIAKRDEIAASLEKKGKCKIVNSKDKSTKSACHRLATRLVLGRGSGAEQGAEGGHEHFGKYAGTDKQSRRHAVAPGTYNKLANNFVPGFWHRKNKKGFHSLAAPGAGTSRKRTWLHTVQKHREHVAGIKDYRTAMANSIRDSATRERLLQNIHREAGRPRKPRAKKSGGTRSKKRSTNPSRFTQGTFGW